MTGGNEYQAIDGPGGTAFAGFEQAEHVGWPSLCFSGFPTGTGRGCMRWPEPDHDRHGPFGGPGRGAPAVAGEGGSSRPDGRAVPADVRELRLKRLKEAGFLEVYPVERLFLELAKIKMIKLANGETLVKELSKKQRTILERMGLCA